MRTDPRAACANKDERLWWAFLHDALCHPLMAFTLWSTWAVRFHDWSSRRAWPRVEAEPFQRREFVLHGTCFGSIRVVEVSPGLFSVQHGRVAHRIVLKAEDPRQAFVAGWLHFRELEAEFGGRFKAI